MSDLIDGVVVEYFDIDYEKNKMFKDLDPKDIWGDDCFDQDDMDALMDDDSGEEAMDAYEESRDYENSISEG